MSDIVKADSTALQNYEYGADDIGAGYEHQTSADQQIPFVLLLQALSPCVTEGREGAQAGAWLNTVTDRIYAKDKGFLFVPATTRHLYGEWTPRAQGGGFHGHREVDDPEVLDAVRNSQQFGRYTLENGHELIETFYVYGVICDETNGPEMAVLSFTSAKIKVYKSWQTRIRQLSIPTPSGRRIRPPIYAHLTRIASKMQKNDKGTFYVPSISAANPEGLIASLLPPDDERFLAAKACRELVDSGDARINPEQEVSADDTPF